jgi:polyisoprenoid-binding protein YceI
MATAILALQLTAGLPAGAVLTLDAARSEIRYTVVHKLHTVEGKSRDVEGKAAVREDGSVITQVRVPVASFRSGDANRDSHMLEAVQAGSFPFATWKGAIRLGPGGEIPAAPALMEGEVEFHGVKRRVSVPVRIDVQPDGSLRVQAAFDVSLDGHGVDRPSLLFVKVDDACKLAVDLVLRR